MEYSFILKDNNQKAYRQFTWFLFFMHIIAAAAFILNTNENRVRVAIYVLLGFYFLLAAAYLMFKKHKSAFEIFSLAIACMYAHFWFSYVGVFALLIFAVIFIMVTVVKGKRTTVQFYYDGIHLTRVFKTVLFPWAAMENVVLKDNLLTMDFKTNKIIQVEIVEQAKAVDETEFNLFCNQQLQTPSAVANPDGGL
ncbi:MAG: hypothetical protein JNM14_13105 [Ferruginibacter sp.]|nr:hypothetical protein [Ferruginibacter sp.]